MIEVDRLTKEFRVHRRQAGFGAALRSVFRRHYDTVRAVDELSFSIRAGERVGFLGPNGAGKTTTLKVLSGLLHPTSGNVRVGGHVPRAREVAFLQQITLVMGQKQQLLWDLPPVDTFELNRAVYDVPRAQFQATLDELVAILDLSGIMQKPTRQLSLGERMKCELCAALLHRPGVLFLDEPTIGLDVSMQLAVREFIRGYNERHGATVLLTSHDMDDVSALCPRVLVIDRGRLCFDGSLGELARSTRPEKRIVVTLGKEAPAGLLASLGRVIEEEPPRAVLQVDQQDLQRTMSRILGELEVTDLSVLDPPLEEVLRDLFARTAQAAAATPTATTAAATTATNPAENP